MTIHPDVQWWLDNGGDRALAERGLSVADVIPDACPAAIAGSAEGIEGSPMASHGAGGPPNQGVPDESLIVPEGSRTTEASQAEIRASTLAVIFRCKSGLTVGFVVAGHANAGEYGEDIVCAGVSALAQAAVLALQDIVLEDPRGLAVESEPGRLSVSISEKSPWRESVSVYPVFRMVELGLLGIARSHPGRLSIKYEEAH